MESLTTAIIPRDDRVIFVSLFNCAEFSSRHPKLPKPSTRSPGLRSWSVAGGSASAGFLARSCPLKNAPTLKPGHLVPNIAYRKTEI